jgi:hypothetical protein
VFEVSIDYIPAWGRSILSTTLPVYADSIDAAIAEATDRLRAEYGDLNIITTDCKEIA